MNKQELLQGFAEIRDYWLNVPHKNDKELVDGVIFSMLCLFDGVSSINDFTPIKLVDGQTIINDSQAELHAEWTRFE